MIVEINYNANRSQETYKPLILSSLGNFFPCYPNNIIQQMNVELAKSAIIQKVRYINLKFKELVDLWLIMTKGSNNPSEAILRNILDSPNYHDLVCQTTIGHEYKFRSEEIIFNIRQVLDYLVQLTAILVDKDFILRNNRLRYDSIGPVLNNRTKENDIIKIIHGNDFYLPDETNFLEVINDLFNSFKHCLVHLESYNLYCMEVPTIVSYYQKNNDFHKYKGKYLNHNAYHLLMGFEDTVMRILSNQKKYIEKMNKVEEKNNT